MKKTKYFKTGVFAVTVLFSLGFLFSGWLAVPVEASMQISAGRMDYRSDWIELEDGVTIFWDDMEINSRRGEIDREASIAYLYEDIETLLEQGDIRSGKMTIYLDEDDILFEEDVVLNLTQEVEGDEAEDVEDPENAEEAEDAEDAEEAEETEQDDIRLTTARMLYNSATKSFTMDSGLTIYQGGRTITSDEGDYSEEEEIFRLRNNVEIVEANGDRITSDRAQFHTGEGQVFTAEGNVTIELEI